MHPEHHIGTSCVLPLHSLSTQSTDQTVSGRSMLFKLLVMVQVKEMQSGGQAYRYVVDKADVKERVGELLKRQDLSKYVL